MTEDERRWGGGREGGDGSGEDVAGYGLDGRKRGEEEERGLPVEGNAWNK